jgi:hypothetical protein
MKTSNDPTVKSEKNRKPDLQTSYWKNWAIVDSATGQRIVDFAAGPFKGGNLSELCDFIKRHPEQALHDPNVLEQVAFVRESELKERLPKKSFGKILKAMRIDWRRSPFPMGDLKSLIRRDLHFFLKILDREKGVSANDAIQGYVSGHYPSHKNLRREENFKRIYKEYKKVFSELTPKLTRDQAVHFLYCACEHVDQPSAILSISPDLLGTKSRSKSFTMVSRATHRSRSLLYLKGKYVSLYRAGRLP